MMPAPTHKQPPYCDANGMRVIAEQAARIAELEAALRSLHMATLHPDNVLRGAGVREALDRAEELIG